MDKINIEYNKNEDAMLLAVSDMNRKNEKINLGGGIERIKKQHEEGKLTARERINLLVDKDTPFFEIGAFAAYEMYAEHGGCPAAGVVAGLGKVEGRLVMIVANDATVKAGAWFPMSGKKNLTSSGNSDGKQNTNHISGR
jgi:3-methylcrotonyl-CoA carboxylase beta subunit